MATGGTVVLVLALGLTGCGDDGTALVDASADAPDVVTLPPPPEPAAPMPPAPPVLTPCPDGWRTVTGEDGIDTCDPWPASGRAMCAPAEEHFPGEPGCGPIGSPCPAGDFPDDLPASGVLYVLAAAAPGGDGTRAAPFQTIGAAVAIAEPDTTIAVGEGDYDEALALPPRVTLRGACVTRTRLTASGATFTSGVITVQGALATVRDLRIEETPRVALFVSGAGRSVDVQGVLISGASGMGIAVFNGARLSARDLVVRGTRHPGGPPFGRAISVERSSAYAEVRRAVLSGNGNGGDVGGFGSELILEDVAVLDGAPEGADNAGRGFEVFDGARLTVRESVFERLHVVALNVVDGGTVAVVEAVVVRDGRPDAMGGSGHGLDAVRGGRIEASQLWVERALDFGLRVEGASSAELRDIVIRDTLPQAVDGAFGAGLAVRNGGAGRAEAEVTRAVLDGSRRAGAYLGGAASLRLDDVVIRRTRPQASDGSGGQAVHVFGGASLAGARVVLDANRDIGLSVTGRSSIELTDVAVRDTGSRFDGTGGNAIELLVESAAVLTRASFEGNREVALYLTGGSTLRAEDLLVRDTLERECAETSCRTEPAGTAVGVYSGASFAAQRFRFEGSPLCGVQLVFGGEADLHDGRIVQNAIGVCAQDPGFDTALLRAAVLFEENGVDVDTQERPVPPPTPH